MPSRPSLDQLEQVHELNRLFLAFLQSSARDDLDCLGLPPQARGALRGANTAILDSVAEFPRALFRLTLDERLPLAAIDPLRSRNDGARYAIALMILQSARTLSRQSTYHARLLMGLESRAIQRLRGLQLKELPGWPMRRISSSARSPSASGSGRSFSPKRGPRHGSGSP